ncbi:hypothetical protein HWV62_45565 [Athelia sp. TMB]|nr:hypothetical protein HWV62_45565 [Athelia sp. TMB]
MPLLNSRSAPEKFSGNYAKVRGFLEHYELLLEQHNVHSEVNKCELVTRYCSKKVTEFIQVLSSYIAKDWNMLKADILKYYDADLDSKRYKEHDLSKLVKGCRDKKIRNLSAWHEYSRKFIPVAGWLLKKRKVTQEEYATYYWNGIPKSLRHKLENRLVAKDPTRSLEQPFSVEEINAGVEALLQRHRFDSALDVSDSESEADNDTEDSEDSDDESEDDIKRVKRRLTKKVKYSKKNRARESVSDSEDESSDEEPRRSKGKLSKNSKKKAGNSKGQPLEIEALIKELNSMSIEDPTYAALVFRASKLDPSILNFVRAPVFNTKPAVPVTPQPPRDGPAFYPPRPPRNTGAFQQAPAFQPNPGFQAAAPRPASACYGCGMDGHPMSRCPGIDELIAKGAIQRDQQGRLRYVNGAPIRKYFGETLVAAVRREQPQITTNAKASNLVQVLDLPSEAESDDEAFYCEESREIEEYDWVMVGDEEYEDDSEESDNAAAAMWTRERHVENGIERAYPVTRGDKRTAAKRKEVLEGVYPPPRKTNDAATSRGKENQPTQGKDAAGQPKRTVRMQVPVPILPRNIPQARPGPRRMEEANAQPITPQKTRYDGTRDDAIVEDGANGPEQSAPPSSKTRLPAEHASATKDSFEKRAPVTRQSEVSSLVKPVSVLNQVLNTKINLAIGEVLGISRELSGLLTDKIKVRTQKPVPTAVSSMPVATSFHSETGSLLIRLDMQSDGESMNAIIDTGSQVNIVSQDLCSERINRPIDYRRAMKISDANGGQGRLIGMVKNVPLNCGEVSTAADLYVGQHVPFSLLLGRPWQRSNLVTIDERPSGTYLIFKDRISKAPRYEILVVSDPKGGDLMDVPEWRTTRMDPVPSYYVESRFAEMEDESEEEGEICESDTATAGSDLCAATSCSRHSAPTAPYICPPTTPVCQNGRMLSAPPFQPAHSQEQRMEVSENNYPQLTPPTAEWPEIIKPRYVSSSDETPLSTQSMSSGKSTHTPPLTSVLPLSELTPNQTLRLESELLRAALGDLKYLQRTHNVHSLVLSTSDGLQLGQSVDPAGNAHVDYLFLHGGFLHVSPGLDASAAAKANAFVRVFTDLEPQTQQQWITQTQPPATPVVCAASISESIYKALTQIQQLQPVNAVTAPTAMPPQRTVFAPGERAADSSPYPATVSRTTSFDTISDVDLSAEYGVNTSSDVPSVSISAPPRPPTTTNTRRSLRIANIAQYPRTPPSTPSGRQGKRRRNKPIPDDIVPDVAEPAQASDSMDVDTEQEWEALKEEVRKEIEEEETEATHQSMSFYDIFARDFLIDNPQLEDPVAEKENIPAPSASMPSLVELSGSDDDEALIMRTARTARANRFDRAPLNWAASRKRPLSSYPSPPPIEVFHVSLSEQGDESDDEIMKEEGGKPHMEKEIDGGKDKDTNVPVPVSPASPASTASLIHPDSPPPFSPVSAATRPATPIPIEALQRRHDPFARARSLASSKTALPTAAEIKRAETKAAEKENVERRPAERAKLEAELANVKEEQRKLGYFNKDLVAYQRIVEKIVEIEDKLGHPDIMTIGDAIEAGRIKMAKVIHKQLHDSRYSESDCPECQRQRGERKQAEQQKGKILVNHDRSTLDGHNKQDCLQCQRETEGGKSEQSAKEGQKETRGSDRKEGSKRPDLGVIEGDAGNSAKLSVISTTATTGVPQCFAMPFNPKDPRSIPIITRRWFPGGANNFSRQVAPRLETVAVDLGTMHIVNDDRYTAGGNIRLFTKLGGTLKPLFWGGRPIIGYDYPLPVPESNSVTYLDRVRELAGARQDVEQMVQRTIESLNQTELEECRRPYLLLWKRASADSKQLLRVRADRIYVQRRMHPQWNPLVKPAEGAFLRSATYFLISKGRHAHAEQIDRMLRTPQNDDWEIRELVGLGALENQFREDEALEYFREADDEHWNFHGQPLRRLIDGDSDCSECSDVSDCSSVDDLD